MLLAQDLARSDPAQIEKQFEKYSRALACPTRAQISVGGLITAPSLQQASSGGLFTGAEASRLPMSCPWGTAGIAYDPATTRPATPMQTTTISP
jgi:hypothetical protein